MNLNRFKVSLEKNKSANSKNGIVSSKNYKAAKLSGVRNSINIDLIKDNPDQARSFITTPEFEVLKNSIRREGLLHPIIVYKEISSKQYIIKAGHRRIKALKELGFTEVDCAIFTSKIEATFAAISTNEFNEAIHPIDKGVEVESLIKEFKNQNYDIPIKDIADFYGTTTSTIYEWRGYSKINKSIRAKIIQKNIRSKQFLRKVCKICKQINLLDLSEKQKNLLINDKVNIFIEAIKESSDNKNLSNKILNHENIKNQKAKISNFIYYAANEDEYKIRFDAIKKLNISERKKLKIKVLELLEII